VSFGRSARLDAATEHQSWVQAGVYWIKTNARRRRATIFHKGTAELLTSDCTRPQGALGSASAHTPRPVPCSLCRPLAATRRAQRSSGATSTAASTTGVATMTFLASAARRDRGTLAKACEFRHPSNYRSEQFAKGIRTPIKLSVGAICQGNSDTHQIIGRSNLRGHRLSKPRCAAGPSSSGRSSRVRDHLTGEVERFALSRRPRAAGWARQAAQLFRLKRHGDVC
jgi:hypothetical protein